MGIFDMKKFLINITIFFTIVAVVDFAAGHFFFKLQSSYAKGGAGSEYYICNNLIEDILVMGSSRAAHHYVSQFFSDNIGLSCYNGGQDGNGIVMQYGRWKMISKHHLPKLLIYDVEPALDYIINDNERYIDRLKPFTGDSDVNNYIAGLFPLEQYKLLSKMYRYNYKFLEIISDCVIPSDVNYGYKPQKGSIRQEMINKPTAIGDISSTKIDKVKLECLQKLIREAQEKGVQIVLVSSPYWKGYVGADTKPISELAANMKVPFIDYKDSEICYNPDWFRDTRHLNDKGARVFTMDLIRRLKVLSIF